MRKNVKVEDLCSSSYIADELGVTPARVSQWRTAGIIEPLEGWKGAWPIYHWPDTQKALKTAGVLA